MSEKRAVLLVLICGQFLVAAPALSAAGDGTTTSAQTTAGSGAPASTSAEARQGDTSQQAALDEIIIAAQREKLSRLRQQIEKSEDTFFEAFNKVNTVAEYETHCTLETPTGTRIAGRVCTPKFVDDAKKDEAQTLTNNLAGSAYGFLTPANMVINEKKAGYRKHLAEVTAKDPKLRKMLSDYDQLRKHYDAVRQQKLKGKWIYFGD